MNSQTIKVVIYCCLPTVIWWKSGARAYPPFEIKEGVVLGPMLQFICWTYLDIELICKKWSKNFKNWARFQNFQILRNWDFANIDTQKLPSNFEIECSSFGFSLIFMCFKTNVLQLKLYNKFFNDLNFYTPLPRGVG